MNSEISRLIDVIARDISYVDEILKLKDSIREEVIKLTRDIIRYSGVVITNVHQGKYSDAHTYLDRIKELVVKLLGYVETHPDLKYSGLTYNGLSEFVEAYTFYSIIVENTVPSLNEIGVPVVPYLQGLGDLIGELRRFVIKLLDDLRIEDAERYLSIMERIHDYLKILDYPEPLIPGVKHKVDIAARLIEDTRVLLLSTKNSIRCIESRTM